MQICGITHADSYGGHASFLHIFKNSGPLNRNRHVFDFGPAGGVCGFFDKNFFHVVFVSFGGSMADKIRKHAKLSKTRMRGSEGSMSRAFAAPAAAMFAFSQSSMKRSAPMPCTSSNRLVKSVRRSSVSFSPPQCPQNFNLAMS